MKKKRILFVHNQNDFTGSTKVLSDVLKYQYNDAEKYVLTMNASEGFLSYISDIHIVKIAFPKLFGKTIPMLSSAISLVSRIVFIIKLIPTVDFIYINTISPYYAAITARFFNKELFWHIHEKAVVKTKLNTFKEFVQKHTDAHFIFVSQYVRDKYVLSKKSTCEIQYNMLYPEFTDRVIIRPIQERKPKNIIMVCSYARMKGIYTFVDIARKLSQYNFNLVLSVSEEDVNDFIKEVNPPLNCKVYPKQSRIWEMYALNDLILNLSNPFFGVETFGMTIIEGMAYGLPAVVPNVGGPLEIVDGRNGLAVDTTSCESISSAILEIMEPHNYYTYAKNALESVQRFYYIKNKYV
ncbi:MAG: glycosyltransferase family 4 protein [Bacteroidaceae bacterium]